MSAPAAFGFSYHARALAFLATLDKKRRRQIANHIQKLAGNPNPPGCKKLHEEMDGQECVYRVRSGDFRILYVVRNPNIVVLDIDNRKDVYR